jgi:hypothetical protein
LDYGVVDGYKQLLDAADSNLGWRILAEFFLSTNEFRAILRASEEGAAMIDLVDPKFLERHRRCLEIVKMLQFEGEAAVLARSKRRSAG